MMRLNAKLFGCQKEKRARLRPIVSSGMTPSYDLQHHQLGGHILLLFIIVVPDILIDRHDLDSLSLHPFSQNWVYRP